MGTAKQKEGNRKLTKAEQKRKEQFEITKAQMEAKGYIAEDLTIGIGYANVMAFVLGLPIIAILGFCFFTKNPNGIVNFGAFTGLIIIVGFLALVFVHEFIHGLFWSVFAEKHWKSISFGFMAKYLTPYCTCNEILRKGEYITGGLMPTVILGIIPAIAAIFTGSYLVFIIAALMILSGGGDMAIVLQMMRFKPAGKEVFYIDHPYLAGMVAFVR